MFKNIDKVKKNIGETVFNHINSLSKTELEKQLSELKEELKSVNKDGGQRYLKLKDEEFYLLYRLERANEFKYKDGGEVAIDNLNKNTDLRNNMISYIVNSKSTSKMSDKQYDALENKLLQKSFAQLKKEYDTLKSKNQMKNGGGVGKEMENQKNMKIKQAIEDIVTYATLPPQIDYVKPYMIKSDKAEEYLKSLHYGEKYIDIANKQIESYYSETGAWQYDSLFAKGGAVKGAKFKHHGKELEIQKVQDGAVYTTDGKKYSLKVLESLGITFNKERAKSNKPRNCLSEY
jgi:hypothetical protein